MVLCLDGAQRPAIEDTRAIPALSEISKCFALTPGRRTNGSASTLASDCSQCQAFDDPFLQEGR
jgi:hypothetical protein